MNFQTILVVVLLSLGVAIECLCAVGVLVMRNPFDRLHYLAPATLLGPLMIAAAVLVDAASDSQARIKAVLVALILLATGPLLTHATARAARVRQFGRLHTDESRKEERK